MPNEHMFDPGYARGAGTTGLGKQIGFAAGFAAARNRKAARQAARQAARNRVTGGGGGTPPMSAEDQAKVIRVKNRQKRKNLRVKGQETRETTMAAGATEAFVHGRKVRAGVKAAQSLPEATSLSTSARGDFKLNRPGQSKAPASTESTSPAAGGSKPRKGKGSSTKPAAPSTPAPSSKSGSAKPKDPKAPAKSSQTKPSMSLEEAQAVMQEAHPLGSKHQIAKLGGARGLTGKNLKAHEEYKAKRAAASAAIRAHGKQ